MVCIYYQILRLRLKSMTRFLIFFLSSSRECLMKNVSKNVLFGQRIVHKTVKKTIDSILNAFNKMKGLL